MSKRNLPTKLNVFLSAIIAGLFGLIYFLLPMAWERIDSVSLGIIMIGSAPLSYALWGLIHECIHANFTNNPKLNSWIGRGLAFFYGTPFQVVRIGHLLHHRFNREDGDRLEYYNPKETSYILAMLKYFYEIFLGTFLLELSPLPLVLLPYKLVQRLFAFVFERGIPLHQMYFKNILKPELFRETRIDAIGVVAFYGISFYLYGEHFWYLILILALRGFTISFLDNSYHYGFWQKGADSAYNLKLPRIFSLAMLHFNYHRVHHHHPAASWDRLPQLFAQNQDQFDGGFVPALMRQFKGVIPEPEEELSI